MTLAPACRPTCEARPAAWEASPSTYTPPWKYRTTWRDPTPSMVISAVGTAPSAAAVTVTPAGSGCADVSSLSSRRCSLISMSLGKADCRRAASRFSRCSVLTEDLPSVGGWSGSAPGRARPCQATAEVSCGEAGHCQARRQAGEGTSPDPGDSRLEHRTSLGRQSRLGDGGCPGRFGGGGEQVAGGQAAVGPPFLGDVEDLLLGGKAVEAIGGQDGLTQGQVAGQDDVFPAEGDEA